MAESIRHDLISGLENSGLLIESHEVDNIDLLNFYHSLPQRYPFLLESVAKTEVLAPSEASLRQTVLGRYDILLAFPKQKISLSSVADFESFQREFDDAQKTIEIASVETHLPFIGGWFAYFSYDYAQVVEPTLDLPTSQQTLAELIRIPAAIIFDQQLKQLHLICEADFVDEFAQMKSDFIAYQDVSPSLNSFELLQQQEEADIKYLSGVDVIKEYILDGDVFQVNLSREWQVDLKNAVPTSIYAALRKHNPAPFAALADFGEWQIISSSPERLVRYQKPWVETRPIAGTRRRSDDLEADVALINELISHPKEIAEHIMLIDLERNDLGRICQPGSVEVNELMVVESYQHVHHIVSNVRGLLQDDMKPLDIVHAVFPGGTITGCPKVRCMEIIAELEKMPRNAYTGSIGYINRDGSLDLNILIRTMRLQNDQISFRAGAGIVADSIAKRELKEAHHKAKGLIQALALGPNQ